MTLSNASKIDLLPISSYLTQATLNQTDYVLGADGPSGNLRNFPLSSIGAALSGATMTGAHGEAAQFVWNEENLTLSTGGLTTDTAGNLLPANSLILAVTGYVTTTITTTTSWGLSDGTTANRFMATSTNLTAGSTGIGIVQWSGAVTTLAAGPSQPAAAKVRVTCVGSNPGAGAIRIAVLALVFSAPTS